MNLDQLVILDAIVECRSLKSAAEKLHKTQPALSIAIKKLEEELNITLLDRSGYRLALTREGKEIYTQAKSILKQKDRLLSLASHMAKGNETELKVSVDNVLNLSNIYAPLRKVQSSFPNTELQIKNEAGLNSLHLLIQGESDVAISPWLPTFQHLGEFETFNFGHLTLVPVISSNLIDSLGSPVNKLEDLVDIPHIIPLNIKTGVNPSGEIDSDMMLRISGDKVIKVSDVFTLKKLIISEFGWAIIPDYMIQKELNTGLLTRLDQIEQLQNINVEIRAIKLAHKALGPVGSLFWNELRQGRSNCENN